MAKKIVFIQGAPRKNGNTRAMTDLAMKAAHEAGAEVALIDATGLEFKVPGCLGCQKCQESEDFVCSLGDGVADAVATLPGFDVIVLASPLYWWSYTAQLKIVVDRMYSLNKFREETGIRSVLAGKTLALLATAGGPLADNLDLLERQWRNPAEMLDCSFLSCLFPDTIVGAGELAKDPAASEKAMAFGRRLAA
jgi:multimeric flavodoxin WrbA